MRRRYRRKAMALTQNRQGALRTRGLMGALPPHGECGECVDDGAADAEEQPEGGRLYVAQLVMSPISTIAQRIADRRGCRP